MTETDYKPSGKYLSIDEENDAVAQWQKFDADRAKVTAEYVAMLSRIPDKQIANIYVKPLLSEGILAVSPEHISIMGLTISRKRIVLFYIALSMSRMDKDKLPHAQGDNGFTVAPTWLKNGNDVYEGFKISSNSTEEPGDILLTKELIAELLEVVPFFIPELLELNVDRTLDTTHSEEVE
jgi:hypothetical protein